MARRGPRGRRPRRGHSPHHRGQNDRGQPYCDLELLLRDAAHIERFRDLDRDPPRAAGARASKPSVDRRAADATFRLFPDHPGLYHHVHEAIRLGATTDDEITAAVERVRAVATTTRERTTA